MERPELILDVFGREYPLPLGAARQSRMLTAMLSGRFRESNRVELNFDPLLQPAWELVYRQLLGLPTDLESQSPDVLWDFYHIAEYLQIPDLIGDFRQLILDGVIPVDQLIEYYDRYRQDPKLVDAAALTILAAHHRFEDLPDWLQQLFPAYETTQLPDQGLLLTRLVPPDQQLYRDQSILNQTYGPQYSRNCQKFRQPQVLTPSGVAQLGAQLHVYRLNGLDLACPDGRHIITTRLGFPCCGGGPRPRIRQTPLQVPRDRMVMTSPHGYFVFLPPGFQGNYILNSEYEVLPEINAVVV